MVVEVAVVADVDATTIVTVPEISVGMAEAAVVAVVATVATTDMVMTEVVIMVEAADMLRDVHREDRPS